MESTPPKYKLALKHSRFGIDTWPWFECDLGYLSFSFHPRIEIHENGPHVVCIDADIDALIIKDEDRAELYRIYEQYSFMMQTFFQVVILDDPDYAYPKSIYEEILTFDLTDAERDIVTKQIAGFTCIYLIRDHDTGLTKIGKSDDPRRRLKELVRQGTLMPKANNFSIIRVWDDYPYIEKSLHAKFAEKRIRGEWFNLSDQDIKEALEYCHIYD